MNGTKIFKVDKFLGLNESPDGSTELKLGEASKLENFYITDGYNLKTRPGTSRLALVQSFYGDARIADLWTGIICDTEYMFLAYFEDGYDHCMVDIYEKNGSDYRLLGAWGNGLFPGASTAKLISTGDHVYLFVDSWQILEMDENSHLFQGALRFTKTESGFMCEEYDNVYIPLILTGASPAGGGTMLEKTNILTDRCYLEYSADGQAVNYTLPFDVRIVDSVTVDQVEAEGTYDLDLHTFTFAAAPQKGVNNVRFKVTLNGEIRAEAYKKFMSMRHCEAYNGATDTRLFFYGDGTNVCYYTGAPAYGSGLYIPAGNEIGVDSSASAITGMVRHSSRLMAFKPDGAFTINYEPVTLADGSVVAGFYVRPASRAIGNDMDGQIQTVENYPRTLCAGNLYEWRHNASYYPDERYAKLISQKVSRTLASADPKKIVTCDDDTAGIYYMFLNDDVGTVLVNHYRLDVWSIYTGEVFKNIRFAIFTRGDVLFANDSAVFKLDPQSAYDASPVADGESVPISAVWESGYMAFGADYKRKYSSYIWLSMLPELNSSMDVTVTTDRQAEYLEKSVGSALPTWEDYIVKVAGSSLLSFANLNFSAFSFIVSRAPRIQRIRLKVKKFVYYKLIFRVTQPGARATVLSYDQQVRFSSNTK